jgi:hypothetical protein
MSSSRALIFIFIAAPLCAAPATACEPIMPFFRAAGGPAALGGSVVGLLLAVAVKCAVFAALQKRLSFARAAAFMLLGNVLTTVIGVIAAALVASTIPVWFFTLPIVWLLCLRPAERIRRAALTSWLGRRSASSLAAIMVVAFAVSCFMFVVAQGAIYTDHLAVYWSIKLAAIYVALLVSIALTAFWEEWVVWRLAGGDVLDRAFVVPAIRSNLVVFFGVALYAAVLIFPSRIKAHDFLVHRHAPAHQTTSNAPPNFLLHLSRRR